MIRPWNCPDPVCDSENYKHQKLTDVEEEEELVPGVEPSRLFIYNCGKYFRHFNGTLRFLLKKDGTIVQNQTYEHYSIGQSICRN
jgi:hypothetical protein